MKRRDFLRASTAGLLAASMPQILLASSNVVVNKQAVDYTLVMKDVPIQLVAGGKTQAFTFNGAVPAPVLRVKQGVPVRIAVINQLNQATTIHWHGIRIDNRMDGVPWLTQKPIAPGETFIYEFVCPDAGTFWYHPHYNSLEQLSKGLVGALIVEEKIKPAFDAEVILGLKDWLLNDDGSYQPFSSTRHAARSGTLGNISTINGVVANAKDAQGKPILRYSVPAGGAVRLRMLNMDNTRVFNISLKDQPATLLSTDGMPLPIPQQLDAYAIGAGMRIDIGVMTPTDAGKEIVIYDRKGKFHFELCRLYTVANATRKPSSQIPILPPNPLPVVDLERAEKLRFVFEWQGALSPVDETGHVHDMFWTINRRGWDHATEQSIPEPLARLKLNRSYVMELKNNTQHQHPIHLHGEIFKVLSSTKRSITPYFADTVLLDKYESVQIAFKATNPGKWMFHCHIIEHMKTGLMGYIEIA